MIRGGFLIVKLFVSDARQVHVNGRGRLLLALHRLGARIQVLQW